MNSDGDILDFVCECSDEELRRMVSNVWRDSMLERMNLVGMPYYHSLFQVWNILPRAFIIQI